MPEQKLGRLTRVDLRDEWSSEDGDFTPWLAREENLAIFRRCLRLTGLGIDSSLFADRNFFVEYRKWRGNFQRNV